MSLIIAPEGYRDRVAEETPEWVCGNCYHKMRLKLPACPACNMQGPFAPTKTPQQYVEESKAIREKEKVQNFSPGFDSTQKESQYGTMMLPDQLFMILKAAISGLVTKRVTNAAGQDCYALYIPMRVNAIDEQHFTEQDRKDHIQHICNCPAHVMPEWDLILKDNQGKPSGLIRGWRSVFGIFYRMGLIPWVPDDGRRQSAWTIRQSPLKTN